MGKGRKTHSSTSFQELLHPFYDLELYFKFQSNPMWPYYGRHPPQEAEALIVDLDLACCYYKPYLGPKNLGQKNYLTIG